MTDTIPRVSVSGPWPTSHALLHYKSPGMIHEPEICRRVGHRLRLCIIKTFEVVPISFQISKALECSDVGK